MHRAKPIVANFFAQRVLPQARSLAASVAAGKASIMALDAAAF